MKKYLLSAILLLGLSPSYAVVAASGGGGFQYRDSVYHRVIEEGVLSLSCHFTYHQNSASVNKALGHNAYELERLNDFVGAAFSDSSLYVKRVRLVGYSSIEGPYAVNERIARTRVQGFRDYLEGEYYLSELVPVDISWVAEDWNTLYANVNASDIEGRDEVLRTIEQVDIFKGRENRLTRIAGGRTYRRLLTEFFPSLRRVEIQIEYDLQRILEDNYQRKMSEEEFDELLKKEREKFRGELKKEVYDNLPRIDTLITYPTGKVEIFGIGELHSITHTEENPLCYLCHPKFGIKTNLMHLAGFAQGIEYTTPMLNLAFEYFVTRHMSVEAAFNFSDWKYNDSKEYQGITGYRIEPRYWIPHRKSFSCIYVGAYGQAGDFNLRELKQDSNDETYKLTGTYWEAGLSAGCHIPLSMHWGFDIGVRGGYRYSKGKAYEYDAAADKMLKYDRNSDRLRLNAVILGLTYRWGYK